MKKAWNIVNLIGVWALVILCATQWKLENRLGEACRHSEAVRLQQASTLEENARTIAADAADIHEFRTRLAAADAALEKSEQRLQTGVEATRELTQERDQLTKQQVVLTAALGKWTAAVTERDRLLKEASSHATQLAADRNDAVEKFNALVAKYNASAGEIQTANEQIRTLAAERNESVKRFNDLARKYNALANPGATTKP